MGDCDYYIRAFRSFGLPKIFEDPMIVYKQSSRQLTNTLSDEIKQEELKLMSELYDNN